MANKMTSSRYRGSPKHKNRPSRGRKGTFCPEWTHDFAKGRYQGDPFDHPWDRTLAHEMFTQSEADPAGSGKRYATMQGIAFAAQETGDGTWHGYPEPWNKVPAALKDNWLDQGKVTTASLKRYMDFPRGNVRWALENDDG
jgi:hypothetical protein